VLGIKLIFFLFVIFCYTPFLFFHFHYFYEAVFYKDSGEKVFEYLELQGYRYDPYTGVITAVTENESGIIDDIDNNITIEKVVYLNRLELYCVRVMFDIFRVIENKFSQPYFQPYFHNKNNLTKQPQ
jgi:hypothetical protein